MPTSSKSSSRDNLSLNRLSTASRSPRDADSELEVRLLKEDSRMPRYRRSFSRAGLAQGVRVESCRPTTTTTKHPPRGHRDVVGAAKTWLWHQIAVSTSMSQRDIRTRVSRRGQRIARVVKHWNDSDVQTRSPRCSDRTQRSSCSCHVPRSALLVLHLFRHRHNTRVLMEWTHVPRIPCHPHSLSVTHRQPPHRPWTSRRLTQHHP